MPKNPYETKGGRALDQTGRVYRGGGVGRINPSRQDYVPIRTGRRRGSQTDQKPYPEIPDTWKGTEPEWAIYWAFGVLGMKEHQAFEYEYFTEVTPNGVDFYVYDTNLIIEIFGIYWHYQLGGFKIQGDLERQIRLEGMGFDYIVIDEDDALRAPIWVLREALAGRDHSRLARGAV